MEQPQSGLASRTDGSLVRRVQSGHMAAATELYSRYAQRLLRLAAARTDPRVRVRFDPEDIVQTIFRTFFRRVSRDGYVIPASDDLWKLLLAISLKKITVKVRSHFARRRDCRITEGGSTVENVRPVDDVNTHLELTVEEALQQLEPEEQQVAQLRLEGYEITEIATRLGRSKRSVERLLQQCREHLVSMMEIEANDGQQKPDD